MDITHYVEQLRADLQAASATADEATGRAAERLATALDASVRMVLLEAMSDAAAEITSVLDASMVEVRLKGRDPQFVVTATAESPPASTPDDAPSGPDDDTQTARVTLRLPDALKVRAEEAAGRSRQSLNTWMVEAIRTATNAANASSRTHRGVGQHVTGWAR